MVSDVGEILSVICSRYLFVSLIKYNLKAEWWPCTPKPTLLEQLDWPALRWRREISSLTFFHKIIQRQLPPLTDCLLPFAHSVSNRSRQNPFNCFFPKHAALGSQSHFSIGLLCYGTHCPRAFKKYCHRPSFARQLKTTGPDTNTPPTLTSLYLSHLLSDTSLLLC